MLDTHKCDNKKETNEIKLELYALLGEGYKSMNEGREISIELIKERITKRREQHE